jgi:hypothetical protein
MGWHDLGEALTRLIAFAKIRNGHSLRSPPGEIVMFGGYGFEGYLGDTWTWDGETWIEEHPAVSPSPSVFVRLAYHAGTQRMVLFDGTDTWTWDGDTWTEEHPATSPSYRQSYGIARDGADVLLFGGCELGDICFELDDTWAWDGTTWVERHSRVSPSGRYDMGMAHHLPSHHAVVFGGWSWGPPTYPDTWTWDGVAWTKQRPIPSPSGRGTLGMAYDSSRREVVLFGGKRERYLNDTWTWDGQAWTEHP